MANYTIGANFQGGKGLSAAWVYPVSSQTTTGTGHTSSNPLELEVGDTLTIEIGSSSGPGTAVLSGFSIFTDNSDATVGGGSSITRTVASGGITADTLTITKTTTTGSSASDDFFLERQGPQPPVIEYVYHTDGNTNTPSVFVILDSQGSGGTLKYAQSTTNSVPSTGWQTSSGFTQTRGTTRYYWASQNEGTAGFSTSEELLIPSANPNLTSFPSSTYGLAVFNSDGNPMYTNRRRSVVLVYSNSITLSAGATTTISNIEGADDIDQTFVSITGVNSYYSSGTGGEVDISSRTSTSVTIRNTDTVTTRTVKVQIFRTC